MGDVKDFDSFVTTTEEMEKFIYRSTFVGDGPDLIRNLDTENTMKFFGQSEPGLILFYNSLLHKDALEELETAFSEISNNMLVMKADLNE